MPAPLRGGDRFGSGTLSGPRPEQAGSLTELTLGGQQPIVLANGETRTPGASLPAVGPSWPAACQPAPLVPSETPRP